MLLEVRYSFLKNRGLEVKNSTFRSSDMRSQIFLCPSIVLVVDFFHVQKNAQRKHLGSIEPNRSLLNFRIRFVNWNRFRKMLGTGEGILWISTLRSPYQMIPSSNWLRGREEMLWTAFCIQNRHRISVCQVCISPLRWLMSDKILFLCCKQQYSSFRSRSSSWIKFEDNQLMWRSYYTSKTVTPSLAESSKQFQRTIRQINF